MSQPPHDGVTRSAFTPAPVAPRIVVDDAAGQHGPLGFNALPRHDQTELIQAAEGRQVRGSEGSVVHVEVFQMGSVRTSIIGRPRPSPEQRRATNPYTLDWDEPEISWKKPGHAVYPTNALERIASECSRVLSETSTRKVMSMELLLQIQPRNVGSATVDVDLAFEESTAAAGPQRCPWSCFPTGQGCISTSHSGV